MASAESINWDVTLRLEQELRVMLKDPNLVYQDMDHHFELLRLATTSVTLNNICRGTYTTADARLWDVTCEAIKRYRKLIASFKGSDQRKHAVEKNKMSKRYADFIKTSQYFYKSYIQLMDAHFPGVTDLRKIAHRLDLGPMSVEKPIQVTTPETVAALIKCVHSALIHLGDLSRYRNELVTGVKNWDRARAYYSLAGDMVPADGSAHNQMAVVALQDHNHLDAVYYLYRALAVQQPHPAAKNNLEIEFKKIDAMWKDGNPPPVKSASAGSPAETHATNWLLRLHAKLYKNEPFTSTSHDEMETEFICQTTTLLKDQTLRQDSLNKFALINIAAEYFALERAKENPSYNNNKSYLSLLRLNVRSFFMLLEILQPEFRSDEYEDLPGDEEKPELISPVMRHLLPTLRHYSFWLVAQTERITTLTLGEGNDNESNNDMLLIENLKIHVKEMWRLYASTLCLLCVAFPPRDLHSLAQINYLLEEDAATVGFKPFTDFDTAPYCQFHYVDDEGAMKPHVTDQGVTRVSVEFEMMSRIRDITRDGVIIAHRLESSPIMIAPGQDGVFYYHEERLPAIRPTNGHSPGRSMSSLEMKKTLSERDQIRGHMLGGTILPDTEFTHDSVDQRMTDMVARLVGSREDSFGMNTKAANELFADVHADEFIPASHLPPLHPPSNELPRAQHQYPTIQSSQLADALALDNITGGGIHARRKQIPQHSNGISGQNVEKQTPRPRVSPFRTLTSSEQEKHLEMWNHPFSNLSSSWKNNSSVYAGTGPRFRSRVNPSPPDMPTVSPPRPTYGAVGHHRQSTPDFTGSSLEFSHPGIYGDSQSYEREMMLNSSLPRHQVEMLTPPGGQG